ncbi:MAG: hypothetical protein OEN55_07235 [Alphaproteobacteria bacterium]|nr:hypothetical protein [Alphaproteobacteria bacterium]
MTGDKMDFLNSPEENLRTWDRVSKLMIISGAVSLVVLALLGLIFV